MQAHDPGLWLTCGLPQWDGGNGGAWGWDEVEAPLMGLESAKVAWKPAISHHSAPYLGLEVVPKIEDFEDFEDQELRFGAIFSGSCFGLEKGGRLAFNAEWPSS